MKTTAEKIKVMQAFDAGKEIEVTEESLEGWIDCLDPLWNWAGCDYRVKRRYSYSDNWIWDPSRTAVAHINNKEAARLIVDELNWLLGDMEDSGE